MRAAAVGTWRNLAEPLRLHVECPRAVGAVSNNIVISLIVGMIGVRAEVRRHPGRLVPMHQAEPQPRAAATGASHLLLHAGELGLIQAVASQQVRREVARNLDKKLPSALTAVLLLAEASVAVGRRSRLGAAEPWVGQADPRRRRRPS